jgi:DNA-binding NarL/FixJ family response regulator
VIRVAVVDDQELVRSGFVVLLRASPGIEVVGEAGDGVEAVELARRTSPDVVLMDVRMPRMDGLEATRAILADPSAATTRVLVLTTFDDDELVLEALRSGASGFLLKDTRPTQLLEAIEVVAAGEALLHPRITRRLIERFAALPPQQPAREAQDDGLTGARARGPGGGRSRAVQPRDRRAVAPGLRHGQDARQPPADQARLPGPGAAGAARL